MPLYVATEGGQRSSAMMNQTDIRDVCCVAIELSKSIWVCAFSPPDGGRTNTYKLRAGDVDRLISILDEGRIKAMRGVSGEVDIVVCYEVGYDGFWLARLLSRRGIRTIVFDPASFLRPRRGRLAKTDRLDAEEMTRILRTWLSGDASVARAVHIPTIEEEDAKRIARERKHLVEQRTRIIGRIKGLLALHGVWLMNKRINKDLQRQLDTIRTGDGRPLPPFLRRDVERMLQHYAFICEQIAEVEAECSATLADETSTFPHREKVHRLAMLGGVGETTATVLVAEVYHRSFASRRHLASFIGLAPSPYASGDVSRDRGINKAGTKLARQTLVELAWFWLRYQPQSKLARWWNERFKNQGMRGRKVGIVALARRLAVDLWRFVEHGVVPEGATLKV
jgi:transposase